MSVAREESNDVYLWKPPLHLPPLRDVRERHLHLPGHPSQGGCPMTAETTKSVYRYTVPIDGKHHWLTLKGDPVAVAAVGVSVEFWAEHRVVGREWERAFQVYGTGHPVPASATWRGTAPRTPEGLVWHLYELMPEDPEQAGEASR